MLADFFAQPACIKVSTQQKEQHPKTSNCASLQGYHLDNQITDAVEIPRKGQTSGQRNTQPDAVLACFAQNVVDTPWLFFQFDTLVSIPFTQGFSPTKHQAPDSLRAGKTAPHPTDKYRHSKQ